MPKTSRPPQQGPTGLELISATVSLILKVGLAVVAIIFGVATYSAFVHELFPAILSADSLLWKSSIVLYFTSWYAGVGLDHAREGKIYRMRLPEVKVDPTSAALACVIFVLFGIMYLIEDIQAATAAQKEGESLLYYLGSLFTIDINERAKLISWIGRNGSLVILGLINFLWFFNIFLWRWFVEYFVKPLSRRSIEHYRHEHPPNHFGVLKVDVLNQYLDGQWQLTRFKWGTAYLLALDLALVLVFFGLLKKEAVAGLFAAFVVIFESWVWIKRLQVGFSIAYLDGISDNYDLTMR